MADDLVRAIDVARRWADGGDLCEPFLELLPVTGGSISMFGSSGTHSTLCTTDALAAQLDELQSTLGEGPRWEVSTTRRPAISPDLLRDPHPGWPVFGVSAAGLGVRALFTFPILISDIAVGAVDLYRLDAGGLGAAATARAQALSRLVVAEAASRAIHSANLHASTEAAGAPALRREVHQATGMVLMQLDVSASEALALLRSHAFANAVPLDDVARDVVARLLDFRALDPGREG